MVLNRNPDNFFAETEQVAFHIGNLVPGIDVTNDPLLQARLFSYLDTQLTRLGGPNFHEIPIKLPIVPVHNHQQDGFHHDTITTGKANYHPNSIGGGCPVMATGDDGYVHVPEMVGGPKARQRPDSFRDFFSQATLFFRSLSLVEQQHLANALRFELRVMRVGSGRVVNEPREHRRIRGRSGPWWACQRWRRGRRAAGAATRDRSVGGAQPAQPARRDDWGRQVSPRRVGAGRRKSRPCARR
jgi:catalase